MDKQTKPTNHLGTSKNEAEKQIKRAGAPCRQKLNEYFGS